MYLDVESCFRTGLNKHDSKFLGLGITFFYWDLPAIATQQRSAPQYQLDYMMVLCKIQPIHSTSMKRSEALRKRQGYEGRTAERSLDTTQNTHHILMAATFFKRREGRVQRQSRPSRRLNYFTELNAAKFSNLPILVLRDLIWYETIDLESVISLLLFIGSWKCKFSKMRHPAPDIPLVNKISLIAN